MNRRSIVAVSVVALLAAACGPQDGATDADGKWVGTITTEGSVTTVVNESGSVWGGTATLVEEASIGVEAGEDSYMLGRVVAMAASDDRIYVVDSQVPALRVYDWSGNYLHDFGREGEGPGEFRYPAGVGVDGTGQVWLHDQISTRIVVYSPSGEVTATLNLGGARISGEVSAMTVTADGQAYVFGIVRPDESTAEQSAIRLVMRPYGIDGVAGEPIEIPRPDNPAALEARAGGVIRFTTVPFHARSVTAFTPTQAVIVGLADPYRFEIRHPDGRRTVVERRWEPLAVLPDEATAHEQAVFRYMRDLDPDWVWDGPTIPTTKPAYSRFVPAASGETWVVRPGPAALDPECEEESFEPDGQAHCWPEERVIDVFDVEGRYLGEVSVPPTLSLEPLPLIRGNVVVARVEDDAGTIMVKRYRLVLAGEEER